MDRDAVAVHQHAKEIKTMQYTSNHTDRIGFVNKPRCIIWHTGRHFLEGRIAIGTRRRIRFILPPRGARCRK